MIVLDASAILALLWREAGEARVRDAMPEARVCSVNLAEVVSKLVERNATEDQIDGVLAIFQPLTDVFSAEMSVRAGRLRRVTASKGLSLGDRSCIAFAQALDAPVLTADRVWADLGLDVEIELVR